MAAFAAANDLLAEPAVAAAAAMIAEAAAAASDMPSAAKVPASASSQPGRRWARRRLHHFLRRRFLLERDRRARAKLVDTLARVVRNLAEHPGEPKYASLRMANKTLKARVYDRPGGLDFLRAVGFRARGKTSDPGGRTLVYVGGGDGDAGAAGADAGAALQLLPVREALAWLDEQQLAVARAMVGGGGGGGGGGSADPYS